MSEPLISRSPDLQRLRDDGYELEVRHGVLLLHHIPHLDADGTIHFGTLTSTLALAGDQTTTPSDHVVSFAGNRPHDHLLQPMTKIINAEHQHEVAPGVIANFMFSSKPTQGYPDYFEKMSAYADMLAAPAQQRDPSATARTFVTVPTTESDSVFEYEENASTRAGIVSATQKLRQQAVAIVGLGGTGGYILDQVAKTPVREIHLFDGDAFEQHNAFRAPGAASLGELRARQEKVAYYQARYAPMRRGIVAHNAYVDQGNVHLLDEMGFVFIALDDGPARRLVVDRLEHAGVAFIDVGMGLGEADGQIGGMLRTTLSTPQKRTHVHDRHLLPFGARGEDDVYGQNIQTADLNMLNAALAVVRWKRHLGFYCDLEHEHHSVYVTDGNHLISEEQDDAGVPR